MIPLSPPPDSEDNAPPAAESGNESGPNRDLAMAAEKIKFQITLEEPEDDEVAEEAYE